ncbi:glycoside hydrolase family 88 protein [Pedobacter sp. Du54]|uniref:glycoside hydrolase family 88 protein n=1 Tax=Pedobacter anseongensis TaxID=3133439 RepID=UPI0030954E5C
MSVFVHAQYTAYLFTYFTGNKGTEESIRFAISKDGYAFKALNNNQPIIASSTISETGGVRDPHILRGADGKTFYMVVTDMVSAKGWDSNRGMVLLKSKDLINWTSNRINIQKRFAGNENLMRVWAPQTIYDKSLGKYMVYWSMKHGKDPDKIYYAYANADFTDLETEPKQLFFSPNNGAAIDGEIIYYNKKYYLFYKTEGSGLGIRLAISDELTKNYVLQNGAMQQTKDAVEGAGVFKLNNGEGYILMYDLYTKGKYQFTKTTDFKTYKVIDDEVKMDFHPRHGTVMPITAKEEVRLLKKWGNLQVLPSKDEVLANINKANDYWQANNKPEVRSFWDHAAYHTGNMEAYEITKKEAYKQYSETWATYNKWMGAKSDDKSKWKYKYGETDEHVLFGDWQICFQTYIDLYNLTPDPQKVARAKEVMEYEMSTPRNDYWWWSDGLYMVMPVMTKMYKLTGNTQYLDKLYEYFMYANSIMYDSKAKLYYRDAKYVYPNHKSANGKKDFWARGDGWVFAGLAKVLKDLPTNDPHRKEYLTKYQDMAKVLIKNQQLDGYWTRSILDPAHAPGPETSGTAFFTYGLFWGINNGLLNEKKYLPAAKKGYVYLARTALQPTGKVGFVQPIGEKAIPGQVVDANSTSNFGVGAFLLANCEMYRFLTNKK